MNAMNAMNQFRPVAEAKRAVGWRDASLARNADNTLPIFRKGLSLNPSNRTNGGRALLSFLSGQCAPNIGGVVTCGGPGARRPDLRATRNQPRRESVFTKGARRPDLRATRNAMTGADSSIEGARRPDLRVKRAGGQPWVESRRVSLEP